MAYLTCSHVRVTAALVVVAVAAVDCRKQINLADRNAVRSVKDHREDRRRVDHWSEWMLFLAAGRVNKVQDVDEQMDTQQEAMLVLHKEA